MRSRVLKKAKAQLATVSLGVTRNLNPKTERTLSKAYISDTFPIVKSSRIQTKNDKVKYHASTTVIS